MVNVERKYILKLKCIQNFIEKFLLLNCNLITVEFFCLLLIINQLDIRGMRSCRLMQSNLVLSYNQLRHTITEGINSFQTNNRFTSCSSVYILYTYVNVCIYVCTYEGYVQLQTDSTPCVSLANFTFII